MSEALSHAETPKYTPLVTFLRAHGFEHLQRVSLHAHFGTHQSATDAGFIERSLAKEPCDLFLTELPGYSDIDRKRLNELPPEAARTGPAIVTNPFIEGLLRAVRGRNIPIGFMDIGAAHKQNRIMQRVSSDFQSLIQKGCQRDTKKHSRHTNDSRVSLGT